MIRKKSEKKSEEKSEKNLAKKLEKKPEQKTRKRTKFFSSTKIITVLLVLLVVIAVAGCAIGYYINANQMEEISVEDELVERLGTKYFRGTNACTDYNLGLFSEGITSVNNLGYETKEKIAIDYAVRKGFDRIGFYELNEVYHLLFNDGTNLKEKSFYEATSGEFQKNGDAYDLNQYSTCSTIRPDEMTCLVIDKAYKSDRGIKVITGVLSGTAETQYLYSGLNWNAEPLGIYGEIEVKDQNLAKWEIYYKYDNKLDKYFLDYTKKL